MNNRVRKVRKELGLTLEKFGKRLGVSNPAISKIENGQNNVSEQMIKSICREFNVNESWLRTGEGEMFIDMDEDDELFAWVGHILRDENESFQRDFARMLSKLSPEQWDLINDMAVKLCEMQQKKDKEK